MRRPTAATSAADAAVGGAGGASGRAWVARRTRSWRRWRSGCKTSSRCWSATSRGTRSSTASSAIISTMRQPARAEEPGPLLRRPRHSSGGAASVRRRHRRGEPRQRQHLHDGCGRAARRERASQDPRSGERGRRCGGCSRRSVAGGKTERAADEGAREERGRAAPGSRTPASASWRRAPAACCSTTPTTCARASITSRATFGTTTSIGYTPDQRHVRRHVPQHRGARSSAPASRWRRERATSPSANGRRAGQYLGSARARRARTQARAECISRSRRRRCRFPQRDRPGLVPVVVRSQDGAD